MSYYVISVCFILGKLRYSLANKATGKQSHIPFKLIHGNKSRPTSLTRTFMCANAAIESSNMVQAMTR